MEEEKIKIGAEQAHGIGRYMRMLGEQLMHDDYVGEVSVIKHGADQEFKVEVRIEDSEAEAGERTVAWIDICGDVVEVSTEENRL